eukprot:gb/GECG01007746.1/.p1 GENE.gb/GECG01007746.1/~~gb/GECG01007746.1/.p1  ORF type:complete len:782 (+),score=98.75 gb/GECG01007746.1/:1-2346(+)
MRRIYSIQCSMRNTRVPWQRLLGPYTCIQRSTTSTEFSILLSRNSVSSWNSFRTPIRRMSSTDNTQISNGPDGCMGQLDKDIRDRIQKSIPDFQPTQVQQKALGPFLEGKDGLICSETGSGKTLAYLIPLMQRLFYSTDITSGVSNDTTGDPRLVILVPTQELVHQLIGVIRQLWPRNRESPQQKKSMEEGDELSIGDTTVPCYSNVGPGKSHRAHTIVGTPRAVLENIPPRRLRGVQALVLDEADLLLSGDYANATTDVLDIFLPRHLMARPPQYVFCGATIPNRGKRSVAAYIDRFFKNAVQIFSDRKHKQNESLTTSYMTVDEAENIYNPEVKTKLDILFKTAINSTSGGASGARDIDPEDISNAIGTARSNTLTRNEHSKALYNYTDMDSEPSFDNISIDEMVDGRNKDLIQYTIFENTVVPSQGVLQEYHAALDAEAERKEHVDHMKRQALLELLLMPTQYRGRLTHESRHESRFDLALDDILRKQSGKNPLIAQFEEEKALGRIGKHNGGERSNLGRHARRKRAKEDHYQQLIASKSTKGLEAEDSTSAEPAFGRILLPGTLVFCNSAKRASELTEWLQERTSSRVAAGLHRMLPKKKRQQNLQRFLDGQLPILVCTDIASRGIDTTHVRHVIQYDFATDIVSYFHRIGRTGRMNTHGYASHIVSRDDASLAAAVRFVEENGYDIEGLFSRKRGFRRRLRRSQEFLQQEKEEWESLLSETEYSHGKLEKFTNHASMESSMEAAEDASKSSQKRRKSKRRKGMIKGAYGMDLGVMS